MRLEMIAPWKTKKLPKYPEVNEKNLLHYNMISVSEFPFRNGRNTVEWPGY